MPSIISWKWSSFKRIREIIFPRMSNSKISKPNFMNILCI